jgi:hypothetical protein
MNYVAVYRTRIDKCVAIDHGHAIVHALIYVGNVVDVIHGHVVVDVRDLHIGHARVGDVHVLHITRAGSIPGNENFTWPEREPTYADANSNAEPSAPDERNQSG